MLGDPEGRTECKPLVLGMRHLHFYACKGRSGSHTLDLP